MLSLAENVNENDLGEIFQKPTDKPIKQAPHNLEAEQYLLGAIFFNNNVLNQINDSLTHDHFYAPLHQQIFKAILHLQATGTAANHITLKHYFEANSDKNEGEYLARIAITASSIIIKPVEYSQILIDLHLKRQLLELAENLVQNVCNPKIDSSAMQLLENTEQQLFNLSDAGSPAKTLTPFKVFGNQALEMAERAHKHKGAVVGISTELKSLDNLLGGLQNSDLIILGGRPSMGKTALATTIAYKAAMRFQAEAGEKKPQSVAFFSLEMAGEQLANRVQAAEAELNSSSTLRGRLGKEQFDTLIQVTHNLSGIPLLIDDTPALSVAALRNRARRFKRTHNVSLIIVDYLQLMTGSKSGNQGNRVNEISEITQGLKAIAKELNVPVIALSQLSRAVETRDDKRPQLSDLRESGSIEQDADVVMFVYREQYYLERTKPDENSTKLAAWQEEFDKVVGRADIIVAKQRHGAIGNVTLQFEGDKARFRDCD